jgi:predicted O-methyltransferase YrrM
MINERDQLMNMHIPLQTLTAHPEPSAATFFRDLRELYTKTCTFCVIATMAEENLFSAFLTPTTPKEIEDVRGFSPGMMEYMCDICVHAGFLTKDGETYHITPAAQTYLTADSPYSQRGSLRNMYSHLQTLWLPLSDRLHNGPHVFDRAQFFHDSSLPAMAASTLCGRIQDTLKEIINLPEFPDWERIIDIGGGHGLYAIGVASENPHITAIVQDLPGVIALAEETIKEYGMENQIKTLPGDYLECSLGEPESYDMVLASSTPAGHMDIMSDRIADILKPGGYFINVQPNEESIEDAFSQLEWMLWTFSDANESKAVWKKGRKFPEPGYLEHLEKHGITLKKAITIADPYREGYTVKMLILKKKERA